MKNFVLRAASGYASAVKPRRLEQSAPDSPIVLHGGGRNSIFAPPATINPSLPGANSPVLPPAASKSLTTGAKAGILPPPKQTLIMNPLLTNESKCEFTFAKATPMWHVYTPGNITEIIFTCQEDYAFAINALCITALRYPMTSIVAFEILSNHIHLVISGDKNIVADFFNRFRNKLSRGLPGRLPDSFRMCIKPINDLKSVRNHIVYVHRNAYVANPNVLPYSYPWSSGGYYFQPRAGEKTLDEFSYDEIRAMVKGRFPADLPKDLRITNGHFSPASFCSIKFGQSLFRDAHQYFALLSKNVEAYSELALEIGDDTFLTDEEMFSAALRKCRADYGAISLRGLQRVQIIELARYLHYDLHASNGQLRRILGLTQAEADSLFPLSAKNVN